VITGEHKKHAGARAGLVAEWRSTLRADFAVNTRRVDRAVLTVWRLGQAAHDRPGRLARLVRRAYQVVDVVYVRSIMGAELPGSVRVGPGIRLPHSGRGVVLHPHSRLGAGVTLYHRATLGVRGSEVAPTVGDGVYIGSGAAILGPIHVSDGAKVGANAVVIHDVPAGATAVGVPARILERTPADA